MQQQQQNKIDLLVPDDLRTLERGRSIELDYVSYLKTQSKNF